METHGSRADDVHSYISGFTGFIGAHTLGQHESAGL